MKNENNCCRNDLKNIYMYKLQEKLDENDMIFTQTGLHRNKCQNCTLMYKVNNTTGVLQIKELTIAFPYKFKNTNTSNY